MIENREQQIKSASEIIAYGCSDELKAALIQDFPELAESEDERIRKFLVELVSNDKANNYKLLYDARGVRFDDVLAYLEKQKVQKGSLRVIKDASEWENIKEQQPAEWSEEDDACYELILRELEHYKEYHPDYFSRLIEWFTTRFKSLRPQPHWKPSEEQMDALKHAYSMMNGQAGTDLANLYYDLKKLQ